LKTLSVDEQVTALIVAAHTDHYGTIATNSYGETLSNTDPNIDLVWAPGFDITVADGRYPLTLSDRTKAEPYSPALVVLNVREASSCKINEHGINNFSASASVAGLAAYFLGLDHINNLIRPGPNSGDNAAAMKKYIFDLSYQRLPPADTKTVWNGVTFSEELDDPGCLPLTSSQTA